MPLARPTPAASRPRFHPLRVTGVERLTPAAVAVSFAVPAELAATFDFAAGQYLTLRASLGGADVRRSYSICVSPRDARARGGVRWRRAASTAGRCRTGSTTPCASAT